MDPSTWEPSNVQPEGVEADVTVFVVTNSSSRSPDATDPGTVTSAEVVFAFDEAAERNAGAEPVGMDTDTVVDAESVAPSSSVTVTVTRYDPEAP